MKYILATLRLIQWVNKETGEEQSCYAYSTSGASSHKVFGADTSSSLSVRVAGKRVNQSASDVTLWMNDMTEEEYNLYVESGKHQAYIGIQGSLENPTDTCVISTQEYNAIESPQMLFQRA